MKARIKTTGEIVELTGETVSVPCRTVMYRTTDHREISVFNLEFEDEIKWEQRHFDTAQKVLLQLFATDETHTTIEMVRTAVSAADELIKQIKQSNIHEQ